MRVIKLGKSSVTYEVGVFGPLTGTEGLVDATGGLSNTLVNLLEDKRPAVVGGFTHVFVERDSRRPVKHLPPAILEGLRAVSTGTAPVSTKL